MKRLDDATLNKVVTLLNEGKLIGLPTETVYGLAADANNPRAINKIFAAKGRPTNHPLIVHLPDQSHLKHWACHIPDTAYQLADKFWPGPLTLILKKHPDINTVVTGGKQTIGLRSPSHPIAQQVLQAFQSGLAAPSANRFCQISSTSAQDVKEELGDNVSYVIDGGDCDVGIESTIVDLTHDTPLIVRPGLLRKDDLASVLDCQIDYAQNDQADTPGNMDIHYAPTTPAFLVSKEQLDTLDMTDCAILSFHKPCHPCKHWLQAHQTAKYYAHDLYHNLRELDKLNCQAIYIEQTPQHDEWRAVNDRLKRLSRT